MKRHFISLLAIFFVCSISAMAQSHASSAELKGTVTDPSGAVIPGATVMVTNTGKALTRTATTDENGEYRVLLLPPGRYDVKAEREGFATQVRTNLEVTVGQIAVLDFKLQVGVQTEIVEVAAGAQLVETERIQQSNTIQERYVQNLPIDRRDYLSFTLLAPGIVDSNAFADNTDFRVAQTPQSGISFYGSNGRGNSITVDGGEANGESGGVRSTVSQEAVQEFQINRSNYSAEFGGASGGVINIVTRSGGNQLRGTIFGFFRHDSLDATDPFAVMLEGDQLRRTKPSSERQQYGGSLSFPLKKDRTFFFGAFEKLNRDESSSVPVLTDLSIFQPTAAQNAILNQLAANTSTTPIPCLGTAPLIVDLPPAACAQALRSRLTIDPNTPGGQNIVNLFRRNSGIFPFVTNNTLFSLRLDHQIGLNDQFILRYNYTDNEDRNQNLRALVSFSRGNLVEEFDSTLMAGWNHTFNPTLINELRLQWNYNDFDVTPNDPTGPELNVAGFGFFNRDIFLPSFTIARRYEILDNLSYSRGTHNLKFGGRLLIHRNVTESHTFFTGRFNFGPLPGSAVSPQLATTTVNGLQALGLGAPQFYQQGFGDPTVSATLPFYALYGQDSWKIKPNFTFNYGLRYELDDRKDPLPTDKNNFAPRIGFAWDPFHDGKTTIRGGYGIFYSPTYFQIDYVVNALNALGANNFRQIAQIFVPLTGAPGVTNPMTGRPLTSADIFRTLLAQGAVGIPTPTRTIVPGDLRQFGVNVTHEGPIPPLSVIFDNADDYVNAYSQQASLGIERQIFSEWAVSFNYIFSRTLKGTRARNKNPLPTAPIGPLGIRQWNVPPCTTNTALCFARPLILQDNLYESSARAFYHGFILEVNKRLAHHVSLSGSYTFSKAIDEVTDFNSDFQGNDQTNLNAERALSAFDQRHKVVIYGVLESPFKGGADQHPAWRILSGFAVTPIFRANSGRPFNLLTGADINGDRHSTSDRPPFAGRNTGRGPNFWTFDLRIARRIGLRSERRYVELTFEAFNLFNRLNFASVNNTVGTIAPPFDLKGREDRRPSQPLGFTSAFDPRRIQLGFRLNF
jgi:hypothetical protein